MTFGFQTSSKIFSTAYVSDCRFIMVSKFPLWPSFKQTFDRFLDFWSDGHCQAWNDVSTRWKRGTFWFLFATLCSCLYILYLPTYGISVGESNQRVCLPDDSFSLYPQQFQYWSKSGFFDITLGFGNLTFSQAKIIDVAWDIVSIEKIHIVSHMIDGYIGIWPWRSSPSRILIVASVYPICHNLNGDQANCIPNISKLFFTRPIIDLGHPAYDLRFLLSLYFVL